MRFDQKKNFDLSVENWSIIYYYFFRNSSSSHLVPKTSTVLPAEYSDEVRWVVSLRVGDIRRWSVVSPTRLFANVLFANKLFRWRNETIARHEFTSFFQSRHEKCDTLVYNSFFRPLIRRKKCGNWPITLAKQLNTVASSTLGRYVSETTVNRSDVSFYERKDDHTFSFQISLFVKSVSFLFLPLYCYRGLVKSKALPAINYKVRSYIVRFRVTIEKYGENVFTWCDGGETMKGWPGW